MKAPDLKRAFPPVVTPDTRLLILGSLPGDASLKAAQYYAHPRNGFWTLISGVLGEDLAVRPYVDRLERLKDHGVGLWDVIASAERRGSLDAAIRLPVHADLIGLIRSLPNLRAVAFNGATAARIGRGVLAGSGLTLIGLPSSSAAHASLTVAQKAEAWAALQPHVSTGDSPR